MSWWSALLGMGNGKIRQALQEGGAVIDLRTAAEFDQGHIPGAHNIPVDRIRANLDRIRDLNRPVILCCADGGHCRDAMEILKQAGIGQVYIGGSWESVWKLTPRRPSGAA
jgi:phage shock protein E